MGYSDWELERIAKKIMDPDIKGLKKTPREKAEEYLYGGPQTHNGGGFGGRVNGVTGEIDDPFTQGVNISAFEGLFDDDDD